MLTGEFVGDSKVFVTVRAGCVLDTIAKLLPVVAPEAAVRLLDAVPAAVAVNETWIFVDWPGLKTPRFVHATNDAPVTSGGNVADVKLNLLDGNASVMDRLDRTVLPEFTTCKLNCTVSPTTAWRFIGVINDFVARTPGTPGGGWMVTVAEEVSDESFGSV
jgi:hypothetical protein